MANPQLLSTPILPSYTTITAAGITAIHPLSYFPGLNPTSTSVNYNVVIPPGPSSTSASNLALSGVGSSSTSSSTSTTSSSPVGAAIAPSVTPVVASPAAPTSYTPSPVLSTPSSTSPSTTSQSSSPRTSSSTFTSSSKPTKQTNGGNPVPSYSNRLPNGTVAGIVIGVALGLALITFLATLLVLRRRGGSRGSRQRSDIDGGPSGAARHQNLSSEPKRPFVTQTSSGSNSIDGFLPQSADDKTVQNDVKTVLDQIELHVENFYQNTQASGSRLADAELAMFDSPYLPSSLASLLPQTNNSIPLIKHALAHFITACITTPSGTNWSLLPKDFVLLPNAVRAGGSTRSTKQGK